MQQYDYLIVGAGLFGAAFAYRAKRMGRKCLVIDKRTHLGGNLFCEHVAGIQVHKYGAHIFHTDNSEVWKWVNDITPFNRFANSPLAFYKGKLFNLPFNMNTFYQMWGALTPEEAMDILEEQRQDILRKMKEEGVQQPRNLEEQALSLVGRDIYETLIKGYTEKQWGRKCNQLPAFIIKRLPVRLVFDNNYFNHAYQGIPMGGYNRLIGGFLEGVETRTGIDFFSLQRQWDEAGQVYRISGDQMEVSCRQIVFTGQLDEFFGFCLGHLQYRSLRFEHETLLVSNYQGNAVVNYTDAEVPYTRIIEHKHFEYFGQQVYDLPHTVISREFSTEWKPGMEPYYPVNDQLNNALCQRYQALAQHEKNVIFGGRLAEYKYYDMAPILEKILALDIR